VYRTHYQAIGVDLFDLAICNALSPIRNEQRHVLEVRISRLVTDQLRRFNARAAGYLLDELESLGLCNRNHVLTPLAIGYRAIRLTDVGASRRWFYFMHFLNADGAVLVELMQIIAKNRMKLSQFYDSRTFDELLTRIYEFYLLQTPEVREKLAIRADLARLNNARPRRRYGDDRATGSIGLEPKTRKHKVMFHIQALIDLDFLCYEEGTLSLTSIGDKFREEIPNLNALEEICRTRSSLEAAINSFYALTASSALEDDVVSAYRAIRRLDIPLVSVDSVYAAMNSRFAETGRIIRRKALELTLDTMRNARPSRLHIYREADSDFGAIQFVGS
jgi:hypothetical protein